MSKVEQRIIMITIWIAILALTFLQCWPDIAKIIRH